MNLNDHITTQQYRAFLQDVSAKTPHPAAGFFGPDSMAWQVNREGILALGALRALLMQVAHPLVAQGVAEHSRYRTQPFRRAYNTLKSQQVIVFGSCSEATEALVRLYARHHTVRGPAYSGNDPDLQMWVLGTLIDTVIHTHSTFLSPFSEEEQDAFYEESKLFARLMGIPTTALPETIDDFNAWLGNLTASEEISVSPSAREIAASLLRLPLPIFYPANYILAAGMLPEKLRIQYGLLWTPTMQNLFDLGAKAVRAAAARLPIWLRATPYYWRAVRRARG